MSVPRFAGRVGLVQRVLPAYRAPFFDLLAGACLGGLSVFAGEPRPREAIQTTRSLRVARWARADNMHLLDGPFYLCWQRGLQRWLADWNPDVLILEANPRLLSNPTAIAWMHRRRRPVVGWGLGLPPSARLPSLLRRAVRQRALRGLEAIIAYSRRGAAEYRAAGFPADRVFVAPNAVAFPASSVPARPPLPGRLARLLFVGRLQARKRVDLLLRACAAHAAAELWIVGDGPARSELEHLAGQVYPAAQFFGARHGPALEELFSRADLLVLPGTGGLAVQQAMAFGLPVIVAEGDGTQHDLVRPENGWLIPEGDLAALSQALSEALADPERLRAKGLVSYRLVAEYYNPQTMVQVFVEALNTVHGQG
ncbi:MAG: glycosyltransferase family 4 protein [Chloroflexota bacterium]